jgi:hypothetical protein
MGDCTSFNVLGFKRLKFIGEGSEPTTIWKKTTAEINFSKGVGSGGDFLSEETNYGTEV